MTDFPGGRRWRMCTRYVWADGDVDFGDYAPGSRLLNVEYVKATVPFWRLLVAVPYDWKEHE